MRTWGPAGRWLAAALLMAAASVRAQGELEGDFYIDSASSPIRAGVVELSASLHYPATDQIEAALHEGVTLTFDLEVVVSQPRRFWFDRDLVEFTQRREVYFHAISGRYVVTTSGSEQESFANAAAAIERLGQIERWPIMARAQLRGSGPWRVSMRASVRRGNIPEALRAIVFWSDAWQRTTEWKSWELTD